MVVKISAADAEAFFAHSSQRKAAMFDGPLPEWLDYFAAEGVCGAFHWTHWPGLLMGHLMVKPEAWGNTTWPCRDILNAAWGHFSPERIVGWVRDENRAMRALCLRLGFKEDGKVPLAEPITLYGWTKWH